MKRSSQLSHFAAVVATIFIVALLIGQLSSSDFRRGLYCPPTLPAPDSTWDEMALLHPNAIWNNRAVASSLSDYMAEIHDRGLTSVLRQVTGATWYDVENYSRCQHENVEAERDSAAAKRWLDYNGTGYSFMEQKIGDQNDPGVPSGGLSCRVRVNYDHAGIMLIGPQETSNGNDFLWREPRFNFPDSPGYQANGQVFQHRIRTRAQFGGGINPNTTVFKMYLDYYKMDGQGGPHRDADFYFERQDSLVIKVSDFAASGVFQTFTLYDTLREDLMGASYKIYWPDSVDLWVDWVEFFDQDRGQYLFVDAARRDSLLGKIVFWCDSVERAYPGLISGWAQSDEPPRCYWNAHAMVTDTILAAGLKTTLNPFAEYWRNQRANAYVSMANPQVFDLDVYTFAATNRAINYLGSQRELDTLAAKIERAYQATHLFSARSADLHFTAQVHDYFANGEWKLRNPSRSEIFAEAFIALAHGAKGINFWKYYSNFTPTDTCHALIAPYPDYGHDDPPYAEKWQAVQDVFTQLDVLGDTLLLLDRVAAYCARDGGFVAPITDVHFEDDHEDYIEVGQFHDASNAKYLIIVNRRTNADRHITVQTNLSGAWALRDLYTQKQYISSTGKFPWIPFDSGQGRVFKLQSIRD